MREGYEKYSDGLWRRVYVLGQHYMMIVRDDKARWVKTVRGKAKINAALAKVRLSQTDDVQRVKFDALRGVEPARLSGVNSDA